MKSNENTIKFCHRLKSRLSGHDGHNVAFAHAPKFQQNHVIDRGEHGFRQTACSYIFIVYTTMILLTNLSDQQTCICCQ